MGGIGDIISTNIMSLRDIEQMWHVSAPFQHPVALIPSPRATPLYERGIIRPLLIVMQHPPDMDIGDVRYKIESLQNVIFRVVLRRGHDSVYMFK